jgi:hypothetical protein
MRLRVLLALAGLPLATPTFVGAIEEQIRDSDIRQAIGVARQADPVLSAFHARYGVAVGDPTFDRVEVITEFRRVVMLAEEQLKVDSLWDVTRARPAVAPYRGLVSFVLWIKFPPQNVLPQPQLAPLPNYELILYPKGIPPPPAKPVIVRPALSNVGYLYPAGGGYLPVGPKGQGRLGAPGPAGPDSLRYGGGGIMTGVRVEGSVPLSSLDLRGRCIVGLVLDGQEQRRVVFDLALLR